MDATVTAATRNRTASAMTTATKVAAKDAAAANRVTAPGSTRAIVATAAA